MYMSPTNPRRILRFQLRLVLCLLLNLAGLTNLQIPPACDEKLETQIPPPPYDVGNATHPKSLTPSFSEFDNLTGNSDLPSTTVLSPASPRSHCGESMDYVNAQLALEGDQFDNLRGTKRRASTPEELTNPKRRKLNPHEDLEDALSQRPYVGGKQKCNFLFFFPLFSFPPPLYLVHC